MPIAHNPGGRKGQGEAYLWLDAHRNFTGEQCLRWPFSYDKGVGRGRLGWNGKMYWAHRLMCELVNGPAPDGKPQVAHSCGNGHMGCVNPRHLSWSDQSENHYERRRHGTAATNKWGNLGKLTRDQIDQIRAAKGKEPQMTTAKRFNISHANVRYWQKSTHYPHEPSMRPEAVKRRMANAARRETA